MQLKNQHVCWQTGPERSKEREYVDRVNHEIESIAQSLSISHVGPRVNAPPRACPDDAYTVDQLLVRGARERRTEPLDRMSPSDKARRDFVRESLSATRPRVPRATPGQN